MYVLDGYYKMGPYEYLLFQQINKIITYKGKTIKLKKCQYIKDHQ